jgi:plastocyanin
MVWAALFWAVLLVGTTAQHEPSVPVSIRFADYAPADLDVLAGESVRWTNDSVRAHTVTADDGSFDSGSMPSRAEFDHHFEGEGSYPYHCRLHAGILGRVSVHRVLLAASGPAAPGRPFALAGRAAAADGTAVTIERDTGSGFVPVASAEVRNGRFTAVVDPHTASYRAVADGSASPAVQVIVADHRVAATFSRRGRDVVARATVTPAAAGGTVVLQLRLRERFGWWPVRTARLDRASRALLRGRERGAVRARVVLTLPDRATVLAASPPFRLPRQR